MKARTASFVLGVSPADPSRPSSPLVDSVKAWVQLLLASLAVTLAGCVTPPQPPVELNANVFHAQAGRVGVAMMSLPKVELYLRGAGCLLCIATASAANSTLSGHVKTLPVEDLPRMADYVADALRQKRGADASVIAGELDLKSLPDAKTEGPNVARKDFTSFRERYTVDKLVVIEVSELGMIRTYSAYFPTSDPKALLRGTVYAVNLANNTFEWYRPIEITKSADGKWDEPPAFPGLTNAYFQVLELGKDAFLRDILK